MHARSVDLLPRTIRKIRARLLPLIVTIYIVAYIDKVNVGFAGIQMTKALGLGPAAFGFGAGIFFISYTIFQVPSNLILHRVGARTWIARIVLAWGVISTCMAFMQGTTTFYVLRFFLGAAEAGLLPGFDRRCMLTLCGFRSPGESSGIVAKKFPCCRTDRRDHRLADIRRVAGFERGAWHRRLAMAIPPRGPAGDDFGFRDVPNVDRSRPEQAAWLSADEREQLAQTLAQEARTRVVKRASRSLALPSPANPRVILLGFLAFGQLVGMNGLVMWLPQITKGFELSNMAVGFVVTIPYIFAVAAMLVWARHSDKTGERIWHVALPAFVGGIGLVISATTSLPLVQLVGATMGVAGLYSAMPAFWALPTAFLGGAAAAGGLALINTIANFGWVVGPSVIGYIKELTGHYSWGIASMAAGAFLAGILALTQLRTGDPRAGDREPVTHPTRL